MLKVFNSLTKKTETFKPINPDVVTMYTCGPTVYDYPHIGNWRTNFLSDLLLRTLKFSGFNVKYIMNLTDVGHLTGDNIGEPDTGEDRLEKAADKENKSAKAISDFYIEDFYNGFESLNLEKPSKFTRASEYIKQQIDLVKTLEEKDYTYKTSDGVYFDTSKFADYGKLSGQNVDELKEGARVEINPEKRNPADFALWKFSTEGVKRWQEWQSPWGVGFPGWHLECSAMILSELGESIDFHLGGEDLRPIHHQNEIAQSESATGQRFVKYWVHGAFLTVDGGKMGKSLGNAYTLSDIKKKGFDAVSLRYLYMTAHYRSTLNFTWEALQNAQNSLKKIYELIEGYSEKADADVLDNYMERFNENLEDDLNMPKVLAVVWDLIKSNASEAKKIATLLKFDKVLGLDIENHVGFDVPQKVIDMANTREAYRKAGIWDKADVIRKEAAEMGFIIEDLAKGKFKIKRRV